MPSRRHILAGCSGATVAVISGCLGDSDGEDDTSRDDSSRITDGSSGSQGVKAPPDPLAHPDATGVIRDWAAGNDDPLLAWITSPDDLEPMVSQVNTYRRPRYVRETDFDEHGLLCYFFGHNACHSVTETDQEFSDDQLSVSLDVESVKYEYEDCRGGYNTIYSTYMFRVPLEAETQLAVVERDGETVSNRYRFELERIDDEIDENDFPTGTDITETNEIPEAARNEFEAALDEPVETYNFPKILSVWPIQRHLLRQDGVLYRPIISDIVGSVGSTVTGRKLD